MLDADLLVLDDLFLARRISDAGGEMRQSLVHQRYKLKRSIVVTSKRILQDLGNYLGANPNEIAPVKNHSALPWREITGFVKLMCEREGVSARRSSSLS